MPDINEARIKKEICSFLSETLEPSKVEDQSKLLMGDLLNSIMIIESIINAPTPNINLLTHKFHTMKNILLYGDFYYESDLCQDIELELMKNKTVSNIKSMYVLLIDSLKM